MRVVISVAGQGTRMLPLTKNKSKHLIKVKGKPFLFYLLQNLLRAGYKELILVVGFKGELIEEFVKRYKFRAKIVNQFEILGGKEKEYGTLCPIKCVKDIVGKENFLALYGDNLYSPEDFKRFNIDDKYTYVGAFHHPHPEKYGILIPDEKGFLKEVIEKPKNPTTDLINCGLYRFTPEVFNVIPKVKKSPRGEYELTDAVTLLAKKKKVRIKEIKDFWLDFGNPAEIMKLSKFFKKHKSF